MARRDPCGPSPAAGVTFGLCGLPATRGVKPLSRIGARQVGVFQGLESAD